MAQSLAETFDFTPDDLALNKAGKMSARQRERVGRIVRGRGFIYLFYAAVGIAVFGIIWAQLAPQLSALNGDLGRLWSEGSTLRQAMMCITVLVPAILVLYFLAWLTGFTALRRGEVKAARGPARLIDGSKDRGRRLSFVVVGGVYFQVAPPLLAAFKEGRPYTLYYVAMRPAHAVLSAEAGS